MAPIKVLSVSFMRSVNFFGRTIHSASPRAVGLPLGIQFADISFDGTFVSVRDQQGRTKHIPLANVADLELGAEPPKAEKK